MRAGKLDKSITVQRLTNTTNPVEPWVPGEIAIEDIVTLRAQRLQSSTEEFRTAYGTGSEQTAVFKTRYFDDIRTTDQVKFEGTIYDVKEIKEIGRKHGLEIRTVAAAG